LQICIEPAVSANKLLADTLLSVHSEVSAIMQ